jgi:hypothetical protein
MLLLYVSRLALVLEVPQGNVWMDSYTCPNFILIIAQEGHFQDPVGAGRGELAKQIYRTPTAARSVFGQPFFVCGL